MNIKNLQANAEKAATLLRSMGNDRRLLVLCQLVGHELSVGELVPRIGLSPSALSQHLAVLRAEGLVKTRKVSQTVYYSIKDPAAERILETLYGLFCPAPRPEDTSYGASPHVH